MKNQGNDSSEEEPEEKYGNLKKKQFHVALREKIPYFNSTGTIYANSTITNPSKSLLIQSVSDHYRKMVHDLNSSIMIMDSKFELWDERKHPLKLGSVENSIPSLDTIETHIRRIYQIGDMAPEAVVMSVIYYNRIINLTSNFELTPHTWRRMLLSCLILASKVWEELAVWNKDFVNLFPLLTTKDLTKMEKIILEILKFDLTIKPSEYASVYFNLRAESTLPFQELKPLDKEMEEKLEIRTKNYSDISLAAHQKTQNRKMFYSDGVKPKNPSNQ